MAWNIEFTDTFGDSWQSLKPEEQDSVDGRRSSRGTSVYYGVEKSMARKFKELLDGMTPERRAAIKAGANKLRSEMALDELREARALTQEQLAETLGMRQATVSKMERRADMYVSSLRKIIAGMGGELEIRAVFPSGPVRIRQFRDFAENTDAEKKKTA